jgi:hypothetical protein
VKERVERGGLIFAFQFVCCEKERKKMRLFGDTEDSKSQRLVLHVYG